MKETSPNLLGSLTLQFSQASLDNFLLNGKDDICFLIFLPRIPYPKCAVTIYLAWEFDLQTTTKNTSKCFRRCNCIGDSLHQRNPKRAEIQVGNRGRNWMHINLVLMKA